MSNESRKITFDAVTLPDGTIAKDIADYAINGLPMPVAERMEDPPVVCALMAKPTEDNVALAFAMKYEGHYIYLHGRGSWFKWDGKRWAIDKLGEVRRDIRDLARVYNSDQQAAPAKSSFVKGVESFLKAANEFSRALADFDKCNYLFNCSDATYDLKTGEKKKHSPDDCLTYLAGATPLHVGGECFLKFLGEITLQDKELERFLQRALGSCLSGAIEEHWLMFWTGGGRNGKNTLGDLVLHVMGDYARGIPSSTLMASKNPAHAAQLMTMKGMRLVTSGEIEEGSFWAEAKIKELTGDTELTGQYMRQNWETFPRTHKHLIYGNHRPMLKNTDIGIRSRLKIVPFRACFLGRENMELPAVLRGESSFVLQWLMEGHKMWLAKGKRIGTCEAIEIETKDYFESQPTVELWIAQNCSVEEVRGQPHSYWGKAKPLYDDYLEWKQGRGENPQTMGRFTERLSMQYKKVKSNGNRFVGLKLKLKADRD